MPAIMLHQVDFLKPAFVVPVAKVRTLSPFESVPVCPAAPMSGRPSIRVR